MTGLGALWPLAACMALRVAGASIPVAMTVAGLAGLATAQPRAWDSVRFLTQELITLGAGHTTIGIAAIAFAAALAARAGAAGRFLEFFLALFGAARGARLAAAVSAALAYGLLCGSSIHSLRAVGGLAAGGFDGEGWSRRQRLVAMGVIGAAGSIPPLGFATIVVAIGVGVSQVKVVLAAMIALAVMASALLLVAMTVGIDAPRGRPFSWRHLAQASWNAAIELGLWVAIAFLIAGFVTASELLALVAIYASVLYVWYLRDLRLPEFGQIALAAARAFAEAIAPLLAVIPLVAALATLGAPTMRLPVELAAQAGPWPTLAATALLAWSLGFALGHIGAPIITLVIAQPALHAVGIEPHVALIPVIMAAGVAAVAVLPRIAGVPSTNWRQRVVIGLCWLLVAQVIAGLPWRSLEIGLD